MGKAIFLDSLDFSSNNLGKVTKVKTLFAIEQNFVGNVDDVINTRLNLFGDDMPNWILYVRGVLDNTTSAPATAIDCMLGVSPWSGFAVTNAPYGGDYSTNIGLFMNFPTNNGVMTWENNFNCYIKREGDVISYSFDGSSWTIATSAIDPALKSCPLYIGGELLEDENVGRTFIGQLFVKLTVPTE